MKLKWILFLYLITSSVFAYTNWPFACECHYLGIQAAIATGGTFGIGLTNFTEHSEIGFTVSGYINNAPSSTKTFTPVLFAGLRKPIWFRSYFAYGLDLLGVFGRDNGENIRANYQIGPYISLEHLLSPHILLVGWIDPYAYEYKKTSCRSISTHRIFAAGGIGLTYLL